MAILAGEVLTAARLLNDTDSVALTQTTTVNEWADWGTETVTFDDPGGEVKVTGVVSGYVIRDDTAQDVRVRVAISLDGGSSFTAGNDPNTTTGNAAGSAVRQNVTAHHHVEGTPAGDVVVKAQTNNVTGTGADAVAGQLTAWIHAV